MVVFPTPYVYFHSLRLLIFVEIPVPTLITDPTTIREVRVFVLLKMALVFISVPEIKTKIERKVNFENHATYFNYRMETRSYRFRKMILWIL